MADVRTEREKLVEALADLVVQELADSLPSGRAEGAAALLNGTEYEDLYVLEDDEIRAAVRLAAADLLSEEGEPVAHEHGIRQPGGNVLWLDLGKGPAEKAYLGDGESIVRRPLYPGPVQEASDER